MYELEVQIPFEYAHRLSLHDGKCRFLHGHSGRVTLYLRAETLDPNGFVIDFGKIKEVCRTWINIHWDHATLLNVNDPLLPILTTTLPEITGTQQGLFVMDGEPTAENMAHTLFSLFSSDFPQLYRVRVQETETGHACYDSRQ